MGEVSGSDREVLDLARDAVAAPGLEQQRIGGWLLRAGGGFTGHYRRSVPTASG